MDGNPEGTPNPLNPVQGVASPVDEPEPSMGQATGTGELDFIETAETADYGDTVEAAETTTEMGVIEDRPVANPVDQYVAAQPASFAQSMGTEEPTRPAQPTQPVRPTHMGHGVVDPMMRPVSRPVESPVQIPAPAPTPVTPTRTENNFDTFAMDNDSSSNFERANEQLSNNESFIAKDSIVESAKDKSHKKRNLIICAIILLTIAIICGAAAIAIAVLGNNDDRVAKAIDKLLSGDIPSVIGAKGTISATNRASDDVQTLLPVSTASTIVNFDGTFDTKSSMNKVTANATISYSEDNEVSIDVSELTTKDGATYFKISGISDMFNLMSSAATSVTADDESEATDCVGGDGTDCVTVTTEMPYTAGLFDAIEDEWILVAGDFADTMSGMTIFDNTTTCLISSFGTLSEYSKDLASKYKANPFITYSTSDLKISKRKDNLYKLGIDSEKMSAFVNSMSNNGFVNELNACSGNVATNSGTNSSLFEEIFANFPTMYVEVDNNYNFTRVYFDVTTEAGAMSSTTNADINLSYPSELKITEPDDYIDMSTLLSGAMTDVLTNGSTVVEISE